MIIVQQRKEAFLKDLKFEKIKFQNHLQLKMFKSVKGEMAALIPVGEIASSAESIVAASSGKQEQKNWSVSERLRNDLHILQVTHNARGLHFESSYSEILLYNVD